jgi:molybdenum cofactor cytidylyltransferase
MNLGLIPAAGKSSRMGRPKLLLPLGERSVLEHTIASLRQAGVDPVLVVIGPSLPELGPLAGAAGSQVLFLAEETPDMRSTVVHGLRWLDDHYHPAPTDNWLLLPGDAPVPEPSVIQELLHARAAHPDRTIVLPTCAGRRGHPTLFAWPHARAIRELPEGVGINAYVRQRSVEVLEVATVSASILTDLDTPEDYERLRAAWERRPRTE